MTIQDIAARCSKFSGWNLTFRLGKIGSLPALEFFDPNDNSGQSRLVVGIDAHGLLSEVYGRLRHWGIDMEEQRVMRDALLSL